MYISIIIGSITPGSIFEDLPSKRHALNKLGYNGNKHTQTPQMAVLASFGTCKSIQNQAIL